MYYLFRIFYALASIKMLSKLWWIFYYLDFSRKKIVFKNLNIAFPEKSKKEKTEIAKKTYKNFLTFFEDSIEYNKHPQKFNEIETKGEEYLFKAINSQKPIIIMTAHFGNWEILPKFFTTQYKKPIAIIIREIENTKINKFFKKIRGDNEKIKIINRKKSAREVLKTIIKEKRILGVLIDQFTRNEHAPKVNFFKKTAFNPAISKLAKSLNAIIIPAFIYKENDKYTIEFQEGKTFQNSIEEFTQWQATIIENMIKKHPDQYYWFHNRWKDLDIMSHEKITKK
jgi:KDO2-lipid IV(A) lauroyltransferase